jgi:hypothetical protein
MIIYVDSDGIAIPIWPICGGSGDGDDGDDGVSEADVAIGGEVSAGPAADPGEGGFDAFSPGGWSTGTMAAEDEISDEGYGFTGQRGYSPPQGPDPTSPTGFSPLSALQAETIAALGPNVQTTADPQVALNLGVPVGAPVGWTEAGTYGQIAPAPDVTPQIESFLAEEPELTEEQAVALQESRNVGMFGTIDLGQVDEESPFAEENQLSSLAGWGIQPTGFEAFSPETGTTPEAISDILGSLEQGFIGANDLSSAAAGLIGITSPVERDPETGLFAEGWGFDPFSMPAVDIGLSMLGLAPLVGLKNALGAGMRGNPVQAGLSALSGLGSPLASLVSTANRGFGYFSDPQEPSPLDVAFGTQFARNPTDISQTPPALAESFVGQVTAPFSGARDAISGAFSTAADEIGTFTSSPFSTTSGPTPGLGGPTSGFDELALFNNLSFNAPSTVTAQASAPVADNPFASFNQTQLAGPFNLFDPEQAGFGTRFFA